MNHAPLAVSESPFSKYLIGACMQSSPWLQILEHIGLAGITFPVNGPGRPPNGPRRPPTAFPNLDSEAAFEVSCAVPGDCQFRSALIFEADEQTVHAWIELMHERYVDDGGAMDTDESARIKMRLEF